MTANKIYKVVDKQMSAKMAKAVGAKKRECYRNSFLTMTTLSAQKLTDVIYVEGYAATEELRFPIEHAWVIYNGKVIDPTWDNNKKAIYYSIVEYDYDSGIKALSANKNILPVNKTRITMQKYQEIMALFQDDNSFK